MTRKCGDCQLCCKLLPVPPLDKKAGERCRHQRFGKGCKVYNQPAMPIDCKLWHCRWLLNDDTDDLSRPDHSHCVIDIMPDFITTLDHDTGVTRHLEVVQVWIDPKHPEAHRDPALRRWMFRRALEGKATLVRFNAMDAIVVFAPPFDRGGQWHEMPSDNGPPHSPEEKLLQLGREALVRAVTMEQS